MTNYWNGWTSATTNTSGYSWGNYSNSETSNTYQYWYTMEIKKYLVEAPAKWDDKDIDLFIRLVNIDTKTGFMVTMVIKGDVLITDPTIEKRTMKDFMPLLSMRANAGDLEKINAYFATHPIE